MAESDPNPVSIPLGVRWGYGFGAAAFSLTNTALIFFFAKFLVDEVGLEPGLVATTLLVGKLWDAVTDPVVGHLTDRTRHAMGSRRVWIAAAIVPFALSFGLLWVDWGLRGVAGAALWAALLIVFNTSYTAAVVPYGALAAVMTRDYDERTRLNAARMVWSMILGLVVAVGIPLLRDYSGSYATGALLFGAMTPYPWIVMLYATRGRDRVVEQPVAVPPIWSVLRVPAFQRVIVLFLVPWCCFGVLGSLVPFYVEHNLGAKEMEDAILGVLQISALVTIPAIVWLAGRMEKHRAYALTIASWGIAMVAFSLASRGAIAYVIGIAMLVGPGIAAGHVLPWSMLPDVVEADRATSGVERAGAFYGAMTFLEKAGTAFALWSMLMGLQIAGYDPESPVQSESAVNAIAIMLGPIPALFLVFAAVFALLWPPLTRAQHEENLQAIREP